MCMCVNFAAEIDREVGKVKFKSIFKKMYILPFILQGCCYVRNCGDVANAFMHSELLQKHEPRLDATQPAL